MSRPIVSIPTPDIWYNLKRCKSIPPRIQLARASKAPLHTESGSFAFADPNVPIKEWIGGDFAGMRIDSATTNVIANSNPVGLFANHYGIEAGTETAVTPYGTTTTAYREASNLGVNYNDHVLDFNTGTPDSVSSAKTYSFFVKSTVVNTDRGVSLRAISNIGNFQCFVFFNADGTINRLQPDVGVSNAVAKFMGNGWYRVWYTVSAAHTCIGMRISTFSALYGGQWTAIDGNYRFFIADWQIDRREVRGNPIVTAGSSATVVGDTATIDIPASTKHTLFVESICPLNDVLGASGSLLLSSNAAQHLSMMVFGGGTLARKGAFVRSNALGDLAVPFDTAKNVLYRQALTYDQSTGDIVLCHNGSINPISQKSAGLVFDRLGIGCSGSLGNQLDGYIRRIGYWNTVLTQAQLIELTRIG